MRLSLICGILGATIAVNARAVPIDIAEISSTECDGTKCGGEYPPCENNAMMINFIYSGLDSG